MQVYDISCAQELVNSLQVLQVVAPAMHSSLHSQVILSLLIVHYIDSCLKCVVFLMQREITFYIVLFMFSEFE